MRIHAARLENSPSLQAILKALKDGGWHSAREIREATGGMVEAVSARIQELKANGISIECKFIDGQYRYRLMGPRGKGELEQIVIDKNNTEVHLGKRYAYQCSDSPAPPKWDCWSHLKKEDEQERLF
mgnify:CR=1 FL=1